MNQYIAGKCARCDRNVLTEEGYAILGQRIDADEAIGPVGNFDYFAENNVCECYEETPAPRCAGCEKVIPGAEVRRCAEEVGEFDAVPEYCEECAEYAVVVACDSQVRGAR